uniref:GAG-pre-integrase domain-containing protein n=1 Tax=Nelumbo nucifera TaxID=4432 RepID=A0A822XL32_NELNU|nr:TPA_asm: hypothetical protein HUJ06_022543 [Nelumbo nucifera]
MENSKTQKKGVGKGKSKIKKGVTMGDNNRVQVHGIGTVVITTLTGKKFINDVMYVPGLAQNLLSLGQLMKKGYYVVFDNGSCMVHNKNDKKLMFSISMTENKMYLVMFAKLAINAFTAFSEDSMVWHRRYGHLHFCGLHVMHKLNMVVGLPLVKNDGKVCEACVYGK